MTGCYIKRLYLRNYRFFKKANISLGPGLNYLVGPNNSGKSTILNALNILFGDNALSPDNIEDVMFNINCDLASDCFFTIIAEIGFPNCGSGSKKINILRNLKKARGVRSLPFWGLEDNITLSSIIEKEVDVNQIGTFEKDISQDNEFVLDSNIYIICQAERNEDGYSVNYNILLQSRRPEEINAEYYSKKYYWYRIPVNQYQLRKLASFLLIPAGRAENNQLFKIEQYTWFGQYLKILQKNNTAETKKYFEHTQLSFPIKIETEVIHCLNSIFGKSSFKLGLGSYHSDSQDQLFKYSHLFLRDPAMEEIYYKGHGLQSAVAIALFGGYLKCKCSTHATNRNVPGLWSGILALEEPEAHFHPTARAKLIKVLKEDFVDSGVQVIISTHDDNFPKWYASRDSSLIFPNAIDSFGEIKTLIINKDSRLERLIRFQSATLFSSKVLIVEGCESLCLDSIYSVLLGKNLLDYGITIAQSVSELPRTTHGDQSNLIAGGGVTQIVSTIKLYKELNIKYACLIDIDTLFNGSIKNILQNLEIESILPDGWPDNVLSSGELKGINNSYMKCGKIRTQILNNSNKEKLYQDFVNILNSYGIFIYDNGDFEANFKEEKLLEHLKNPNEVKKESLAIDIKYLAELNDASIFDGILRDGVVLKLGKQFDQMVNYLEN